MKKKYLLFFEYIFHKNYGRQFRLRIVARIMRNSLRGVISKYRACGILFLFFQELFLLELECA